MEKCKLINLFRKTFCRDPYTEEKSNRPLGRLVYHGKEITNRPTCKKGGGLERERERERERGREREREIERERERERIIGRGTK